MKLANYDVNPVSAFHKPAAIRKSHPVGFALYRRAHLASLGFPEMRSGLAPVAILSYLGEYALPRFAFPLVLFGEPIDPHRAQQIGLVSQVCPADRLSSEADALVERILRLDPSAVRRCKGFFLNAQQNSFDQNCRLAVDALTKGSLALLARKK